MIFEEISFRTPMRVEQIFLFEKDGEYPVCPRCHNTMEYEFCSFCDRCGQMLDWRGIEHAEVVKISHKG